HYCVVFFSSRRRHTRFSRDWSSDVCSSDLPRQRAQGVDGRRGVQPRELSHCEPPAEGRTRRGGIQHQQDLLVRAGPADARDRDARARAARRTGRRPRGARLARRLPVCAGRADLCGHQRDPAQHHRRARARSAEILTRSSIVDFTFTEDQIALRDSVSRFLMNEAAPELLREIWETAGGRSPDLRAKIAAQGVTGLSVPEAYGGLGMGDVDWALITEELGYYAIPDSLSDTAYVAAG